MKIIHLSDTHFGTEGAGIKQALVNCIRDISPAVVILSGDITQRAKTAEFQAAAEFLKQLGNAKMLVVPGNHDIPLCNIFLRLTNPYGRYHRYFPLREYIWQQEFITFVGFDATHPLRHTLGKLCVRHVRRVLASIHKELPKTKQLWVIVHQPLLTINPRDRNSMLASREEIATLFSECGVDMVLSGHVHIPMCEPAQNHFELPRNLLLCNAGTSLSHRLRAGETNSFNVFEVDEERITASIYRYDNREELFHPPSGGPLLVHHIAEGRCLDNCLSGG